MKHDTHVVNLNEQKAIAAVCAELLKQCKIDYYPEECRVYVYYHGPNRFNIIQRDVHSVIVKEVRHY